MRRRRMVRNFEDRPIPADVLEPVLDAVRRAPSAGFRQGVDLVVLQSAEQRHMFWETTAEPSWLAAPNWPGLLRAPVIVLPVISHGPYEDRYERNWEVVDGSFGTMLLLLAATNAGLGACFFGIFREERCLLDLLGVPARYRCLGAVALGWPMPDRKSASLGRGRRPAQEVIHRERW